MRFICLLFFISQTITAQNLKYNFLGSLIINDKNPISYSLFFDENNGVISGYSVTNINKEDEAKSEINGLYFEDTKSFQIHEISLLNTNSKQPINSFCYISMNLRFRNNSRKKILEGNFEGNFLDSVKCAEGKVFLIEEEKVKRKIKKLTKKINKISEKIKNKYEFKELLIDTIDIVNDLQIDWESKKVIIYIWDNNKEDGDLIELKINNNTLLSNHLTTKKKKKISYSLKLGENIIEIKALNSGYSPPNTSMIELIDNKKKYAVISNLKKGDSAKIILIK